MRPVPRPAVFVLLLLWSLTGSLLSPRPAAAQGGRMLLRAAEEARLAEEAAAIANAERIAASGGRTAGLVNRAERPVETLTEAASGASLAQRITGMSVPMLARSVSRVEEATVLVAVHDGALVTVSNVSRDGRAPRAYHWRKEGFNLPSVVAQYEYESPTLWDRYEAMDRILRSTRDSTQFVVDQHVFADPAFRDVDVSYAANMQMRDVTGVDRKLYEIWFGDRPFRAAGYGSPVLALARDTVAPALLAPLQGRALRRDEFQVLSLVATSDVANALGRLGGDERVPFDGTTLDALAGAIHGASRRQLMVMGYSTGANDTLWAMDAQGQVTFPVSYTVLRSLAPAGVTVVPVGVNAQELQWQNQPFGAGAVAARLSAALDAPNQLEFYHVLAGNDLNFLLRPSELSPSGTSELRALSVRADERGTWHGYPIGTVGLLPAPPQDGPGFWSRHPVLKWGGIGVLVLMVLSWLGGDSQPKPAARRA